MIYEYKYPRPAVTADCVVITQEAEPRVLLVKRGFEPFKGCWAFPGGFMCCKGIGGRDWRKDLGSSSNWCILKGGS